MYICKKKYDIMEVKISMIIYKRCSRCGKRIETGTKCPCYDRGRSKRGRCTHDDFYHSAEWGTARCGAIHRTYGLDILAWYERGELVTGFTVHHITPLEIGWDLRSDPDNLIYLTESDHREVHQRYLTDYESTSQYLRELLLRFDKDFKR